MVIYFFFLSWDNRFAVTKMSHLTRSVTWTGNTACVARNCQNADIQDMAKFNWIIMDSVDVSRELSPLRCHLISL